MLTEYISVIFIKVGMWDLKTWLGLQDNPDDHSFILLQVWKRPQELIQSYPPSDAKKPYLRSFQHICLVYC